MPPRKPADRRQNRSTKDIGTVVAMPSRRAPEPPAKLRPSVLEAWAAFWSSDIAALVQPGDMPALRRLFDMYDERERMEAVYRTQPFTEGGATGRAVVLHPAAGQISSLDARILALEDRFGLTPLARLRLGITFGAAARSLDHLNAEVFEGDDDDEDPRVRQLDQSSGGKGSHGTASSGTPL